MHLSNADKEWRQAPQVRWLLRLFIEYLGSTRYAVVTLICALCCISQAQIVTPYNPDSNQDSAIGSADLVDFLAFFGYPFTPDAIEINGEDFLSTLITLTEQV